MSSYVFGVMRSTRGIKPGLLLLMWVFDDVKCIYVTYHMTFHLTGPCSVVCHHRQAMLISTCRHKSAVQVDSSRL